ncbi:MAG: hypothetical protein JOZ91_02900 [Candidatus Eremiobacteraeota bacterium]|nr:hypothetical protein [Candidatus Eremiobacteraeota bacterium]MBV8204481.1 hypothetical protein [Candidatus Eremiobacteraeota bacterium]MBV8459793.1 hypothetical protein [Candidatus Eremiobacteraeota bacterium]MBV8596815.1 hypothetical protein [Candidatus Eremiobacteraeota bacterium]
MPRTLSIARARIAVALCLALFALALSLPAAAAPTFTILHTFSGVGADGAQPQGGLLQDIAGKIHGETQLGGLNGVGTDWVMSSSGSTFNTLYNFGATAIDGQAPTGGLRNLVGDAEVTGIDFGVAQSGGSFGLGTVFIADQLGNEITIHNFTGGTDGGVPVGRLLPWVDGSYYGTAADGGQYGYGTVFRIAGNGSFKVLHAFNLSDGANPLGGLQYGNDGNFYGSTVGGGKFNEGVVYKISPTGSFSVIYNFTGGTDGGGPQEALATDFHGNLYGTTSLGGTGRVGTIFRVNQWGSFTTLYTFPTASDGTNPKGSTPLASLTLSTIDCDRDLFTTPAQVRRLIWQRATGRAFTFGGSAPVVLYGSTTSGGNATNSGVIFSFNVSTKTYTILYAFSGSDGAVPDGKLLASFDGNLYGTTTAGGANGVGVVFKIGGVLSSAAPLRGTFQGIHRIH